MKRLEEAAKKYGAAMGEDPTKPINASYDGFIEGAKFAQEWISVENELPERDCDIGFNYLSENILLKNKTGNMFGGYYDYDMEEFYNDFGEIVFDIIDWRPININQHLK